MCHMPDEVFTAIGKKEKNMDEIDKTDIIDIRISYVLEQK